MSNHEDYAHIRDPQTERTKWELWAIVAIVVVVVVSSIVWRAVTHHPGKLQTDWRRNTASSTVSPGVTSSLPAAAADNLPH
jgi:uncharacterized membrane protein AbrB (regulator of aidB expression)